MNQEQIRGRRFAICTLGCKVNQEEGVALANVFREHGWVAVEFGEEADVYIVNSCTVTHLADRKSRQMLRRAVRRNPQALVVATGCYAQVGQEAIVRIPGVDLIVGTNDRHRLFEEVLRLGGKQEKPRLCVTPTTRATTFHHMGNLNHDTQRTRAYIKIEDGCSQFCSYCIIPYARGPVRSRPLADILDEGREMVAKGYRELVLTGIHTGAYGSDLTDGLNLAKAAAALAEIPGLHRLRLGSIEPQEVTEELLAVMVSHDNICPHLHIPLQACDDAIIAAMNRHYTMAEYGALLANIRQKLDNPAVTTDLIVGFPGETPEIFRAGLRRLEGFRFADMHIFPYSRREGTPAASLPNQIDARVKTAEVKEVSALRDEMKRAFQQQQLGRKLEILTEQKILLDGQPYWTGHSPNYLPLAMAAAECPQAAAGQLYQLKITEIRRGYLTGKVI